MGRSIALAGLCLVLSLFLAWPGQARESGSISFKVCWQTGPVDPDVPEDKCEQPGEFIRVEVRRAKESGRYRQSAQSPWRINYTPDELLFAVFSDAKGRLELELPPGAYFIRPLGDSYHSVGPEFFQIKAGENLKALLRLTGNI